MKAIAMSKKFFIEIALGNDCMLTDDHVDMVLSCIRYDLEHDRPVSICMEENGTYSKPIKDVNGNVVGSWGVREEA